ncbi:hypothetical protein B4117_0446 [Bacillus mycoides]|nr:hypothetical protein B4117_0446 [Bacillus mycoides]
MEELKVSKSGIRFVYVPPFVLYNEFLRGVFGDIQFQLT